MSCQAGNDSDLPPGPEPSQDHPVEDRFKGVPLESIPHGVTECNNTAGKPIRRLPRIVLHLSGNTFAVTPARVLCDTGASHCVMSPACARTLGCEVPKEASGHGTMTVADGSKTPIYGWTRKLRVRPPTHLRDSTGGQRLVTALPSMRW